MTRAAPKHLDRAYDPTFYPVEDKVGEDTLQRLIVELLRPLIERWLAAKGTPTFVGADQFVYYKQFHPGKVVGPDVFVLPGVRLFVPFQAIVEKRLRAGERVWPDRA